MQGEARDRAKRRRSTKEVPGDVVIEIDARSLTPALFMTLQPTWVRLAALVLPLLGAACAFRLTARSDATTVAGITAIVGVVVLRIARHLAASRALRRALPDRKELVGLGPEAVVRDGVRIRWDEVTDAAEIDTPMPKGEAVQVIAVRARGTWCVITPVARFARGDYGAARAIINAARHVRVVTL